MPSLTLCPSGKDKSTIRRHLFGRLRLGVTQIELMVKFVRQDEASCGRTTTWFNWLLQIVYFPLSLGGRRLTSRYEWRGGISWIGQSQVEATVDALQNIPHEFLVWIVLEAVFPYFLSERRFNSLQTLRELC